MRSVSEWQCSAESRGITRCRKRRSRIARARNIDPASADVFWGFELPCLGSAEGLDSLDLMLSEHEIDVLIVDPIYLSLMGDETRGMNAGNLFDIGPVLMKLAATCKECSTTMILLHHCRKNSPNDKFHT